MKWTTLFIVILLLAYCSTEEVRENKPAEIPAPKSETVTPPAKSNFLNKDYAREKLLKNQTDAKIIGKAKALIHEANTLSKLNKNEEAISKFEEAFEYDDEPEQCSTNYPEKVA